MVVARCWPSRNSPAAAWPPVATVAWAVPPAVPQTTVQCTPAAAHCAVDALACTRPPPRAALPSYSYAPASPCRAPQCQPASFVCRNCLLYRCQIITTVQMNSKLLWLENFLIPVSDIVGQKVAIISTVLLVKVDLKSSYYTNRIENSPFQMNSNLLFELK